MTPEQQIVEQYREVEFSWLELRRATRDLTRSLDRLEALKMTARQEQHEEELRKFQEINGVVL